MLKSEGEKSERTLENCDCVKDWWRVLSSEEVEKGSIVCFFRRGSEGREGAGAAFVSLSEMWPFAIE